MSYVQPENSNRVNSIKQKFESAKDSDVKMEQKCLSDNTKESLCRTLSASPVAPRKNLKLNVTRQSSNPGRNIKRTPAFRGDKLARTKNLNSPTKEKTVSLVDKNVKLFEDKPEYGKIGNVKKKALEQCAATDKIEESVIVYDDVGSTMFSDNRVNGNLDLRSKFKDNLRYGKICSKDIGKSKDSRSQSLDRLNNKQTSALKVNECKDSVRTTVISRHKNISAISGTGDNNESIADFTKSNSSNILTEFTKTVENNSYASKQLDKFLKNGVEYTKVMKTKSSKQFDALKVDNQSSAHNSDDDKDQLPDIREELSRRKYRINNIDEEHLPTIETDAYKRVNRLSKNLPESDRFHKPFSDADDYSVQTKLNFVPVKDIILNDKREGGFENKLTDTLKAALKAPLPSGPPPKKPPRTFAHSPITNRSPVDDYEEIDGFWQKKKPQVVENASENVTLNLPDARAEKIHSFLHDSSKQIRRSLRDRNCNEDSNKTPVKNVECSGDVKAHNLLQKMPNLDSCLHKIMERSKNSPNIGKNVGENSMEYEPVAATNANLSSSLAKLGIETAETLGSEENIFSPVDFVSGLRGSFSPKQRPNESASSEENSSASPLNISYSPQKFKTSPVRSSTSGRSRTSKDSKEMLEKLEHVLTQHQKACGPKVIIPRTDKHESGNNSSSDTEARSNVSRHKEIFQKRLSRTLEESKKLGPLPNVPDNESERMKNSGFDCLPSLNCAGNSSIYEQIQNPDFKTYLPDTKNACSLERSENIYMKSGVYLPQSSRFYLDKSSPDNSPHFINPDPYDSFAISPASKRLSTELTTFSDAKKQMSNINNINNNNNNNNNNSSKKEEHVYAEPFSFNTSFSTDVTRLESATPSPRIDRKYLTNKSEDSPKTYRKKGAELHYMCTPIPTAYVETNNNHVENDLKFTNNRQKKEGAKKSLLKLAIPKLPTPDNFDKSKIEQLLDQAFGQPVMAGSETPTDSNTSSDTDSLTSSTSVSEEHPTFNEKLQIFKEKEKLFRQNKDEVHRSQTEERKHYVRRVSSKFTERREGISVQRIDNLFEVCILVELNLSTRKPYVKDQYPIHATTPAWIENFCFPDGMDWPPSECDQNLEYTFVLTDEKGNRRYGYCRRVKPEGAPVCLPLAYCLITKHRASGFYAKLLNELESRHGQPDKARQKFIEQMYNSRMPKPGESLRLKPELSEDDEGSLDGLVNVSVNTNNNVDISKWRNSHEGSCNDVGNPNSATTFSNSERFKANEDLSDGLKDLEFTDELYSIIRLDDQRLEEKDMIQLLDTVSIKVLLILFASLLLERKVVLTCKRLSKLSACVEALQSLLYPFSWPHPFIPFLPNIPEFSEILQAPSPFVIGILKQRNGFSIQVSPLEDGIVVDLDTSKVISAVGDESSILPSRLQKSLKSALQTVLNSAKSGDGFRNLSVSEAFLRVFVQTCAHCDSHIVAQQDGKIVFEKESFIKAAPSRGVQYFLEWFVETTMFNQFIQDRILRVAFDLPCSDQMKLFDRRLSEYLKAADQNSQTKKGSTKKKTFGDRFKDLTNFNN